MATAHQPLLHTTKTTSNHKSPIFLVLSLASIVISVTLLTIHFSGLAPSDALHNICDHAHDQKAECLAIVSEITSSTALKLSQVNVLQQLLNISTTQIQGTIQKATHVSRRVNDPREQAALQDCVRLMELSVYRIQDSIAALDTAHVKVISHANAHTWLSGVLTNHETCLDGLTGPAKSLMDMAVKDLILRARTSLAILVAVSPSKDDLFSSLKGDFPSWLTSRDRKLLQSLPKGIKANVVVAKDGSGNFKTVKEAVASAPNNSKTRYVIHVKKGTYKEKVVIGHWKKNVMIVGDGMDSTIITGSLYPDISSCATVDADGDGFIAQDIWFQNTAGPQKQQAVALRVGADLSVINRCRIDAYQDTLYAHANRQFYRDCNIIGTVDFIFGNAAVVLQNCKIEARKPMAGQSNMVTAQGRTCPNQNTGTSIQNCNIIASSDLERNKSSIRSYLGRPWKEYSRTVVMQSYIGDHIDPSGWFPWKGEFALKTIYYGEYMNRGPRAGTSKRVKWPGYRVITSAAEARKFTVAELIQGGFWLKSTGVAFTEGL